MRKKVRGLTMVAQQLGWSRRQELEVQLEELGPNQHRFLLCLGKTVWVLGETYPSALESLEKLLRPHGVVNAVAPHC